MKFIFPLFCLILASQVQTSSSFKKCSNSPTCLCSCCGKPASKTTSTVDICSLDEEIHSGDISQKTLDTPVNRAPLITSDTPTHYGAIPTEETRGDSISPTIPQISKPIKYVHPPLETTKNDEIEDQSTLASNLLTEQPVVQMKKQSFTSKPSRKRTGPSLKDMINDVTAVQVKCEDNLLTTFLQTQEPLPSSNLSNDSPTISKHDSSGDSNALISNSLLVDSTVLQTKKQFKDLIDQGEYWQMMKLGDGMQVEEFLENIIPAITDFAHFKNLYEYLKRWRLCPQFLAKTDVTFVKRMIVKGENVRYGEISQENNISEAVALFFKENKYDHITIILEAVQEKFIDGDIHKKSCKMTTQFEGFMTKIFHILALGIGYAPLVHFFTHYWDKFVGIRSIVFESILVSLIQHLRSRTFFPSASNFLTDLIAQPLLLQSSTLVTPFLCRYADDTDRAEFIKLCWREALEEAMTEQNSFERQEFSGMIRSMFPRESFISHPKYQGIPKIVFEKTKTKQELEDEWKQRNAPEYVKRFENLVPGILPRVPLDIVLDYASIGWALLHWDMNDNNHVTELNDDIPLRVIPKQSQITSPGKSRISERFFMDVIRGDGQGIIKTCKKMNTDDFRRYLCPVIETLDHYKRICNYLKSNNLFVEFVTQGKWEVVQKVIYYYEYDYTGDMNIPEDDIYKAIIVLLEEDRHERVFRILAIIHKKSTRYDRRQGNVGVPKFQSFMVQLFQNIFPGKERIQFKRFLTFHGEELKRRFSEIYETLCMSLVSYLKKGLDDKSSRELLTDFIGQPFLLTEAAFARAFLTDQADARDLTEFVRLGWQEVIKEKLARSHASARLRGAILDMFPDGRGHKDLLYGISRTVIERFKTKEQLEAEWSTNNAVRYLKKIESLGFSLEFISNVLWIIIAEYAVSWIDVD